MNSQPGSISSKKNTRLQAHTTSTSSALPRPFNKFYISYLLVDISTNKSVYLPTQYKALNALGNYYQYLVAVYGSITLCNSKYIATIYYIIISYYMIPLRCNCKTYIIMNIIDIFST